MPRFRELLFFGNLLTGTSFEPVESLDKKSIQWNIYRSSHRRCSVRKGVLRNFAKFAGKHLCQSLFVNKVAGLKFCEISKNTFFTEKLRATASAYTIICNGSFKKRSFLWLWCNASSKRCRNSVRNFHFWLAGYKKF